MKHPKRAAVATTTLKSVAEQRIVPPYERPGLTATDRAAREEIQHRAYAHWEQEGHPTSRHLEHWLAAEAEVIRPPESMRG